MTAGLATGGKLRESQRVVHTPTAAIFPIGMSVARYSEYGLFLKTADDSLAYWRSSWLKALNREYPGEVAEQVVKQLDFSFEELDSATLLAFVPDDAKTALLTVQHHTIIGAALEQGKMSAEKRTGPALDEAGARQWLGVAAAEELTASELRDSIAMGKVVKNLVAAASSNRGGMMSVQNIRTMFTRWQTNMERKTPIDQMALPLQEQIYEEIKPIGELFEKLKAKLNR